MRAENEIISQLPAESLLDLGRLPVAELARIAMREGVRPRAAYQAHKWFARRFAVTARALLVGAACAPTTSFWRKYYRGDSWNGRTVLDPFVGGGVMLLEARRLGASVVGVDIEPVAAAIAQFQTTLPDLPDLNPVLDQIYSDVGRELAPYYRSESPEGHLETLLHAFWVQTLTCARCATVFDAHPSFRLAWNERDNVQWVTCCGCSRIQRVDFTRESIDCDCGARTNCSAGRLDQGRATCPECGHSEALIDYSRRTGRRPQFQIFGVETLPGGNEVRVNVRDRVIRSATDYDRNRAEEAEIRLQEVLLKNPSALPYGRIPTKGRRDYRLIDYGYVNYLEMFNSRQKLHLALLGAAIDRLDGEIQQAMAIAFSDHLTTNNMFCAYAGGWRRLAPLFSIRAFRHIARPVEINPWLRRNGRGTFPNAVRAVLRAAEALRSPREPSPRGLEKRTKDSFNGQVTIKCGSATALAHIQASSVDLVLTDPPYFDYVSYSELGHFFAPWFSRFRLISRRAASEFPKGQIAAEARSLDAERRFAAKLSKAFLEMRRVCKPAARIVFTYQNLDGRGWNAIAKTLAATGVIPFQVLPLYGDSSASLHKCEKSISWDAVLVCRVGTPIRNLVVNQEARETGSQVARAWSEHLKGRGLGFTEGDLINLGQAASIVSAFGLSGSANVDSASRNEARAV